MDASSPRVRLAWGARCSQSHRPSLSPVPKVAISVPPGIICLMSIYGTHHNPDIWPEPQVEPLGLGGRTMGQRDVPVTMSRDNRVPAV